MAGMSYRGATCHTTCGCVSIRICTCKLSCMNGANLRLNYIYSDYIYGHSGCLVAKFVMHMN